MLIYCTFLSCIIYNTVCTCVCRQWKMVIPSLLPLRNPLCMFSLMSISTLCSFIFISLADHFLSDISLLSPAFISLLSPAFISLLQHLFHFSPQHLFLFWPSVSSLPCCKTQTVLTAENLQLPGTSTVSRSSDNATYFSAGASHSLSFALTSFSEIINFWDENAQTPSMQP